MKLNRRSFLKRSCSALILLPASLEATALLPADSRSLSFHNLHTGEKLTAVYWERGYVADALKQIDHVLRDHRNGEVHTISPHLLDTLFALSARLNTRDPFEIISGFRSPSTNARLRLEGHAVAEHSLHMDGLAVDIRIADRALPNLRDAALSLKAGGVGYYPKDQFVHVDVGRIRTW